ncbi:heavy-metal-associated domain-containing protein [Rhodobacteraceae bacterium M385]|nr:heavy-metal-associated domain-containing protein [Rhodobacteraceae bacterium M385]
MRFNVPEMSCGHCKSAIETAIKGADPAATLDFDMPKRAIEIESSLAGSQLQSVMKDAGYESAVA